MTMGHDKTFRDLKLGNGLSRRALLARSAGLGATSIVGSSFIGQASRALADVPPEHSEFLNDGQCLSSQVPILTQSEVAPERFSHDDMGTSPTYWTHNGVSAEWGIFFWWLYITGIPSRRPILAIRAFTPAGTNLTLTENGEGLFSAVTPLTAPGNLYAGPAPYNVVQGDPDHLGLPNEWTYELGSPPGAPTMLNRFGTQGNHVIEGNILDLRGEYLPFATAITPPGVFAPYFTWAAIYRGTLMGMPVWSMGGSDRFYNPTALGAAFSEFYIAFVFSGVHQDGRREWGQVYIVGNQSFGAYYKDGEVPVVSNNVQLEAVYVSNPANPNDIAPQSLTASFEGKQIHWTGTSTAIPPSTDLFGPWLARGSSSEFVRSLGAVESNIPPGSVRVSGVYKGP
jgi:hypothetical protein